MQCVVGSRGTRVAAVVLLGVLAGPGSAWAASPNSVVGRVEALEAGLAAQQAQTGGLALAVAELQAAVAALQAAVAALEDENASQGLQIAGLQAQVADQAAQIAALEAGDVYQAGQIAALESADLFQAGQIAALESADLAQAGQIAVLEAADATQAGQIAALEAALAALAVCPEGEAPVCCPAGTDFCPGAGCVDVGSDPANCGACGVACGPGLACVSGVCALECASAADCGGAGDACTGGVCSCGGGEACAGGAVCVDGACTLCGNGVIDPGEECDDGNTDDTDLCTNACTAGLCAPDVIFAVGVFGTTTCASRCASQGELCVGIGTDDGATNGLFNDCGSATSGVATTTSPGTCDTVLGGQGCSEFTSCRCAPLGTESVIFAVGVFGTTSCDSRCQSEGGVCVGIGTDDGATNGLFNDCGSATSGVATMTSPGTCATVLGGQGCSEFTSCRCQTPDATCTEPTFAVGVFGTTTCASRCVAEGGTCVGLGTDAEGLNGLYNACPPGQTSGVATTTAPGDCDTVLGGDGCSEFATCRCYPY